MDTRLVDEIYVEKEKFIEDIAQDWEDFIAGEDVSTRLFGSGISESFEKFEKLLENRWITLQDNIYYDKDVGGCWKIVVKKDSVVAPIHKQFNTGTSIKKDVKKHLQEHLEETLEWDIPTADELKHLHNMSNTPFRLNSSYNYPDVGYHNLLYKNGSTAQGTHMPRNFPSNQSNGSSLPLLRLPHKNNRELFYLFVAKKLIPKKFIKDRLYRSLLSIDYTQAKPTLEKDISISSSSLVQKLLSEDSIRADIAPYDKKMLEDTQQGCWSLWVDKEEFKEPLSFSLKSKLVARDPRSSINRNGIVGIDFGTKSTVVVYQNETTKIHPMRVGTGDLAKAIDKSHYENPTIMEFNDINSFISEYKQTQHKPHTKWSDLCISHTAYNSLRGSSSEQFNTFLDELKQWAGDSNKKLKIVDKKGEVIDLPPFLELSDDLNPIEIYAYYLGLYINNQNNGIFLNYTLSFPVTYELKIRQKILESFYRGIKKSLPSQLDKSEIEKLDVDIGASEPAAYAIIALEEYKFDPCGDERVFYGVFDFGGGTTDFDFGIFRESSGAKERRFDYVCEHFGAEGDRYLGGENLLELLAFEVFKKNKDRLLAEGMQFEKHPEKDHFAGSEKLLANSQEAKMNTKNLCEGLRAFWEESQEQTADYESGTLGINLVNIKGETSANFELDIDSSELKDILQSRIARGINNFFESLRLAFSHKNINLKDVDTIHIFLAGNSSKSRILKELFSEHIKTAEADMKQEDVFKLYEPLGLDSDDVEKPTGKTGVAFGLIRSRDGGNIKIVNHNMSKGSDIRFKYYLGENRKRKFKTLLDRETPYNKWIEFIDASEDRFEIYYTTEPSASTNTLKVDDSSIKKLMIELDKTDEDALVYLRAVTPTTIEYVVALEDGIAKEEYMSDIKSIKLG